MFGLGIVFFRILELLFASGCVYLTYKIAKKVFNEKIAVLSALFLAFSPTFYFFSTKILSGIPSLFFSLLGVYFFLHKKYFFSGLLLGIAFMTRFLQLFVFIVLFSFLILNFKNKKNYVKNIFNIVVGFFIVAIPYLIFNYFIYNNPIFPFILQNFLTKNTGFVYHQTLSFYFNRTTLYST